MPEDSLSRIDARGLAALESRLKEELEFLCYPGKTWVPPTPGVADVVIVGGGMCGMVAWLALTMGGVSNTRIFDRSPEGQEGPWVTYARMETLRSPKQLTGPAYGLGPLTFQAWYRAQFGTLAWDRLGKIPRRMWMDYLRWYRRVLGIPVENGVCVDRVEPEGDLLRLGLSGVDDGHRGHPQARLRDRPRWRGRAQHSRFREGPAGSPLGAQQRRNRFCSPCAANAWQWSG